MTILEILKITEDYFIKRNLKNARLDAEFLLASVLKINRMQLYLQQEKPLSDIETDTYREYVKRRAKHEPIQYILGNTAFYGLEFNVNKNVLIPRPDTEILVEEILNNVDKSNEIKILDIGTGSGCIAISLAANLPKAEIIAVDISNEALLLAKDNAVRNNVSNKIQFVNLDILGDWVLYGKFDVIVSNPPYIEINEYNMLDDEVLKYEPIIALTDNNNGMTFYDRISSEAPNFLTQNGKLFFEVAYNQADKVMYVMEKNKFINISKIKDYNNQFRVVKGVIN